MFTGLVRIGCDFPTCGVSPTLDPELDSAHLETILFCRSMSCRNHLVITSHLSYTVTILSSNTCWSVVLQYPEITP